MQGGSVNRNSTVAAQDIEGEDAPERYRTAQAYLAILGMMSPHRALTSADVAGRLAEAGLTYTTRNVQLMLRSLAEVNPDLVRDDSEKPYRYRWRQGAANPWNPDLGDREALVLLLAAEHLRQLLPAEVLHWMDARFDDARRRLDPASGTPPFRSWNGKVAVVSQLPPMISPAISPDVLAAVSTALLSDRWLNLDYRNAAGSQLLNRRVMPLALVRQGERLFLVCRFDGYQDTRNLALHRILSAEATPHPFERPKFSLQTYIDNGGFGFGNGERVRLVLRVAPHLAELLAETPLAADQAITEDRDGWMRVAATVLRSEQVRWWIRGQGNAVEVLEPAGLLMETDSGAPARTPTDAVT